MAKDSGVIVDPQSKASLDAALRQLVREVPAELDKGATKAGRKLASESRSRLAASSRWGALVAPSIVPIPGGFRAGGGGTFRPPTSPHDATRYSDLFFGAEYGVKGNPKWPGHRWKGKSAGAGYGIWSAIRASSGRMYTDWTADAVAEAFRIWSHHG